MSAVLFVMAMLGGFPLAAVLGLALLGRARFTAFRLRRPREAPLTVRLADGRMLGYALHGARAPGEARKVVFYLHGLMGSRLEFSGMRKEFTDEYVTGLAMILSY